jgi:hypothetical protein
MGILTKTSYDIECKYNEEIDLTTALEEFGKFLFKEGFIEVHTSYDKETGQLYRKLSISANKEKLIV